MESFQLVNSWNEDDKYHSNILAMMANGCTIVRTGMVTHSAAAGVCHSSCWLVVGAAVAPRVTGTSTRYPYTSCNLLHNQMLIVFRLVLASFFYR